MSKKAPPLAKLVDQLYEKQQLRYKLQNEAKKMKKDEEELEASIIAALAASDFTTGVSGKIAYAQMVEKEKIVAEDWDEIYKYVLKNKAFELLQRRLSDEAVKDRWNNDDIVPGIGKIRIKDLSLKKL